MSQGYVAGLMNAGSPIIQINEVKMVLEHRMSMRGQNPNTQTRHLVRDVYHHNITAPLEVTAPRPPGEPVPTLSEVMAEHKRYVDNFTKVPVEDYSGMTLNMGTSLSAPPVQCTFNIPAVAPNGDRLAREAPPVFAL
ncbi:hypothetical protein BGZ82_002760 [Podila clonocystis]|nr:hypothetical protein BGZ82_002760 [Podila clonocystis]